jgi:(p)ppGpp synthase/HD superfamily hydrolase
MSMNPFVHAVDVAARAFEHRRRDDSHELYLTHALDVADALGPDATLSELSTAVLHDVLEDSDWTTDDLAGTGIEATIVEAVEVLTRRSDEEDDAFIARICAMHGDLGVTVQRVKLADVTVNLAKAESDEEREHYERSLAIVGSALDGTLKADGAP